MEDLGCGLSKRKTDTVLNKRRQHSKSLKRVIKKQMLSLIYIIFKIQKNLKFNFLM